jgi:hypothetical protein
MSEGAEITTKGTGIRSSLEYIAERYGVEALSSIISGLPEELRDVLPNLRSSGWYPARFHGEVWTALARDFIGPDRGEQARHFHALGRHVAGDHLSSVYSVLISLAWPDTLLSLTPRLWSTYFDGVRVEVQRDPEARRGAVTVSGLGDVAFLAPVSEGWLTRAYEMTGARMVEVVEESWLSGLDASDRLVFDVRWA